MAKTIKLTVQLTVREKKYNLVYDKRVVNPATAISYPFGYEYMTQVDKDNLETLLELL